MINFKVLPTRNAEIIVPIPTLPKDLIIAKQMIKDITTIEVSKQILTFSNGIPLTILIAAIAPSPARGINFGGKYKNIPKAIATILIAI